MPTLDVVVPKSCHLSSFVRRRNDVMTPHLALVGASFSFSAPNSTLSSGGNSALGVEQRAQEFEVVARVPRQRKTELASTIEECSLGVLSLPSPS
ncbi:hypothetical protein MUK42_23861 [Musa troglodytarum]|uniref:Uncharacterized protein n=1 Tax=Musa troglodytarum TaxID=320322 RepID=A0A9E7GZ95_9LILI|nr:hypothetical protein MUK42_23861 [Musa troglodytarum]